MAVKSCPAYSPLYAHYAAVQVGFVVAREGAGLSHYV